MVSVELVASAHEFLLHTEAFRWRDPVRTNLLSTVAESVATGSRSYDQCFWWIVRDGENVVGVAVRTAPFGYIITAMDDACACALAERVAEVDPLFPFVSGNRSSGNAFLEKFIACVVDGENLVRGEPEVELLYELKQLHPHTCTSEVSVVHASMDHFDLIRDWLTHFHEECKVFVAKIDDLTKALISGGRLRLLRYANEQDDEQTCGEYVALAGYNAIVGTGRKVKRLGRIGPVYTPPARRGHGFASAITHAVCREILELQATPMLFAQAENPVSNRVYQRLGFEFVSEQVRFPVHRKDTAIL